MLFAFFRYRHVARRAVGLRALLAFVAAAAVGTTALAAPPAVTVDATMASRVLACTACHGQEGRATPEGYFPRIAGKPAAYLYNQLRNFRDGRRSYPAMNGLLEYLSDDYLMEMATYFSRMDVPYPAPQTHNAAPATLERGRVLVQQGDAALGVPACVACHGTALTGVQKAIPGLVGLPRDYLNAQLAPGRPASGMRMHLTAWPISRGG